MSERTVEEKADDPTTLLDLPHGKGLKAHDTATITKRSLTSVILFAGTAQSGKTTLLATLHLLFQYGPFAGYNFAGSDTLVGFEDRVNMSRTASGRSVPTTPRTAVSEYLHFRVRREDCSQPIREVILCDLWGDDFREAKDNVDVCKQLNIIKQAHRFVLLIDGGKLASEESRQSAKNDPLMLLRNCLETGMLGKKSMVDVLITKWDLIQARDEKDEIVAYVDQVEEDVRRRAHGQVCRLRFGRIASHAPDDSLPLGHGLDEMFPDWVEAIWGDDVPERGDTTTGGVSNEFDRYYRRQLPGIATKG